jgi:hypothetical protein
MSLTHGAANTAGLSVGMFKRSDGWWMDGTTHGGRDSSDSEDDEGDGSGMFDDAEHCEEWSDTGNEGVKKYHRYYTAAIVFRPV